MANGVKSLKRVQGYLPARGVSQWSTCWAWEMTLDWLVMPAQVGKESCRPRCPSDVVSLSHLPSLLVFPLCRYEMSRPIYAFKLGKCLLSYLVFIFVNMLTDCCVVWLRYCQAASWTPYYQWPAGSGMWTVGVQHIMGAFWSCLAQWDTHAECEDANVYMCG